MHFSCDVQRGEWAHVICEQRKSRWACASVQTYTTISIDSVSGKGRHWSACAFAQVIWACVVRNLHKAAFRALRIMYKVQHYPKLKQFRTLLNSVLLVIMFDLLCCLTDYVEDLYVDRSYILRKYLREALNSCGKKQTFNGIRDVYTVSGPCPAGIDACTTPTGHASDCEVSKRLRIFRYSEKSRGSLKYCP